MLKPNVLELAVHTGLRDVTVCSPSCLKTSQHSCELVAAPQGTLEGTMMLSPENTATCKQT